MCYITFANYLPCRPIEAEEVARYNTDNPQSHQETSDVSITIERAHPKHVWYDKKENCDSHIEMKNLCLEPTYLPAPDLLPCWSCDIEVNTGCLGSFARRPLYVTPWDSFASLTMDEKIAHTKRYYDTVRKEDLEKAGVLKKAQNEKPVQ